MPLDREYYGHRLIILIHSLTTLTMNLAKTPSLQKLPVLDAVSHWESVFCSITLPRSSNSTLTTSAADHISYEPITFVLHR